MLLTDYQKGYILYSRNTSKGISERLKDRSLCHDLPNLLFKGKISERIFRLIAALKTFSRPKKR